jgi:alkylhydroperoxidase/carboxymuconolactone decarboxylase family protein YurZ
MADREEILRRLTIGDQAYLDAQINRHAEERESGCLDHVGEAVAKLGALTATDGSEATWQATVRAALDAGLTRDEVVDLLVVLAPVVGRTRVISAAPKVAHAIGYDVEAALEAR